MLCGMPFEVYSKSSAAAQGAAIISIQQRGVISLNRAAFAALGEPGAVELLYDRERRLMGLRSSNLKAQNAQRVRTNSKGSTYLVSAASFMSHYDIPMTEAHRWIAQMEGDVVFIDLNQPPIS